MSGILGIVHLDGTPVNRGLLAELTQTMAFRGPDGQHIRLLGPAGLGHALLRTAPETECEQQPVSVDGNAWLVADARIDGRTSLISELRAAGRAATNDSPDGHLILHAYHAWGVRCVDHLLGDFAFAIWDASAGRLFCARDHFGVRPFYYLKLSNRVVFSNTLDLLRRYPGGSNGYNDLALADFLLFDSNQEPNTTAFAHIYRLPPAHVLDCQAGALSVRRYWTLPEAEPIRYGCAEDYVERFSEIFDTAVGDRLRTNAAGLLLSGGLDSPTVAISARRVLGRRSAPADLRACTLVYSSLIRSDEGRYAGLAAEALRIPIEFLTVDQDGLLNDQVDRPNYHPPEPVHLPLGAGNANPFENLSSHSRVALTGFGGDPALASLLSRHFRSLMEQRQFGRMLADVAAYLGAEGRFSRLYLRTRWKRWFGSKTAPSAYPTWLHEDLESQLHLRERWEDLSRPPAMNRSARPEAYAEFTQSQWSNACELLDAGAMGVPIEVSHPFFDLRVVNFLIALPALPCCSDKEILRISARGILPPAVRLRRKSPLASDPVMALLQKPESAWMDQFKPGPTLNRYVRRERIPPVCGEKQSWAAWVNLRPLSLNSWLERCEGEVPRPLGGCHERAVTSAG